MQIAWAATEETTPGAYVEASKKSKPLAFAESEAGYVLEDELRSKMVELWAGVVPQVGKIVG